MNLWYCEDLEFEEDDNDIPISVQVSTYYECERESPRSLDVGCERTALLFLLCLGAFIPLVFE